MKTAILLDSSCNIRDSFKRENVFTVPLMIIDKDNNSIKDDDNFTEDTFYDLSDNQLLKTSQTVVGDMLKKWDELLKDYDEVICLLLSKGLSGQFNTYKLFSQEDEYKNKVFVVDTNGVSVVLERQLEMSLNFLEQGKSAQEILEIIEAKYSDFKGFIIPKSLDKLVAGGRITKAAASIAKLLKITPILSYTGIIDKEDKTRTFKKAIEVATEKMLQIVNGRDAVIDLAFSRTDLENKELFIETIKSRGLKIGYISELPNVIVCHTGRDTFVMLPYFE